MTLYHHPRRGTTYRILFDNACHNSSAIPAIDRMPIVVYQDIHTGEVSTRLRDEFMDGRFIALDMLDPQPQVQPVRRHD